MYQKSGTSHVYNDYLAFIMDHVNGQIVLLIFHSKTKIHQRIKCSFLLRIKLMFLGVGFTIFLEVLL